ncbi:hypothetical protein ACVXHA_09015 [Escherichia coli]
MVLAPSKGVGEGRLRPSSKPVKSGYFRELFDLCARTDTKKLNRRVLEKTDHLPGRFDRLGPHRAALMNSLGDALKAADQTRQSGSYRSGRYVACSRRAGTN